MKKSNKIKSEQTLEELSYALQTEPITLKQAKSVLSVINKGLCEGKGEPIPGRMCVEAAVCYGLGLPHSDEPICVHEDFRGLKIQLNDIELWKSKKSRGEGMKRVAIAQLGSNKPTFHYGKFQQHFCFHAGKLLIETICDRVIQDPTEIDPDLNIDAIRSFKKKVANAKTTKELVKVLRGVSESIDYILDYQIRHIRAAIEVSECSEILLRTETAAEYAGSDLILKQIADIMADSAGVGGSEGYLLMNKLLK